MKIDFNLNGKNVSIDTPPQNRLVDILREQFSLFSPKARCYDGHCGLCLVLFNNTLVNSCLIPAFALKDSEVLTYEGMARSRDMGDISRGFSDAGYAPCEYCKGARYLAIHDLLENVPDPGEAAIMEAVECIKCNCTDLTSLIRGVQIASLNRKRKRRVRKT